MHQLLGVDDLAAEGLADALVAEAHAENRHLAGEFLDQRHRDARLVGRARAGRNHDMVGLERRDLLHRDLVVAEYPHLLAQLAEILHQVVGEGIVVVDHQQHI